jgi:hypothetical protein
VSEPNWIPVEERLPEIGAEVLVYCGDEHWSCPVAVAYRHERRGDGWSDAAGYGWSDAEEGTSLNGRITHWMPLPEPPK